MSFLNTLRSPETVPSSQQGLHLTYHSWPSDPNPLYLVAVLGTKIRKHIQIIQSPSSAQAWFITTTSLFSATLPPPPPPPSPPPHLLCLESGVQRGRRDINTHTHVIHTYTFAEADLPRDLGKESSRQRLAFCVLFGKLLSLSLFVGNSWITIPDTLFLKT